MNVYHLLFLSTARCYMVILWRFSQSEVEKCIYCKLPWQWSQPAATQEPCCIGGFMDWWMAGWGQTCRGDCAVGTVCPPGWKSWGAPLLFVWPFSWRLLLFSTSQGTAVKGGTGDRAMPPARDGGRTWGEGCLLPALVGWEIQRGHLWAPKVWNWALFNVL